MGVSGEGRGAVAAAAAGTATGRPLLAFAWMMGAVASFTLMAVAGRAVQAEMNSFQLMAWRSLIGICIVSLVIWRSAPGFAQIRTGQPWLHVQRNIFHFTGQNAWFVALTMIPLAQLVALEFTSPIWVTLLAPLIIGDRLTLQRLVAVFLGFAGVLIVAQPGTSAIGAGHALGLLAAFGFALNAIWTKRIMARDSVLCVLFWMTASQTVLGFLLSLPWGGVPMPSAALWPWVIVVALTGLTAHFSLTSALSHAQVSVVAPMEFIRLPVVAAVGALLYGEAVALAILAGGLVILCANLVNLGVFWPRRRAG
jgi:drug/metabolite transporter (DMT)-like permease